MISNHAFNPKEGQDRQLGTPLIWGFLLKTLLYLLLRQQSSFKGYSYLSIQLNQLLYPVVYGSLLGGYLLDQLSFWHLQMNRKYCFHSIHQLKRCFSCRPLLSHSVCP